MARKSDRELVSFRLDPDLADFLRQQARLHSISLTELVNRLLHWTVPNVTSALTAVPTALGFQDTTSLGEQDKAWRLEVLEKEILALKEQIGGVRSIAPPRLPVSHNNVTDTRLASLESAISELTSEMRRFQQGVMIAGSNNVKDSQSEHDCEESARPGSKQEGLVVSKSR